MNHEERTEIVEKLSEYGPQCQAYVATLPPKEWPKELYKTLLSQYATELKIAKAEQELDVALKTLKKGRYTNQTKESAIHTLTSLKKWLETI